MSPLANIIAGMDKGRAGGRFQRTTPPNRTGMERRNDMNDLPRDPARLKPLTPRQARKLYSDTFERPFYVRAYRKRDA